VSMGELTVRYAIEDALDNKSVSGVSDKVAPLRDKIDIGFGFSASDRLNGVVDGGTLHILLENPANSGRTIYVVTIECTSTGQADVDVYDGGTITGGTAIVPRNLDLGSNNQSVAVVTGGGTYNVTGLTPAKKGVVPGGTSVRIVGGSAEVGESIRMPPGTKVLVVMTNRSGVAANMAIGFLWWEQ